jgi:hypothetical protein
VRLRLASWPAVWALASCAALALVGILGVTAARGERTQQGNLIVSLLGDLAPLKLPRDHPAPTSIRLEGGLQSADGALLPRVRTVELGLPSSGVIDTRGLPTCSLRQLRNTRNPEALSACRDALVGRGSLEAEVQVPNQAPFRIHAELLAFNGRARGRRAVILHAFSSRPPTVVVLPFVFRPGSGRFGTALVAQLRPSLGPWPHLARFAITLGRRFRFHGRTHSYISASCPIPEGQTAGFASFARSTYTLAGGRQVSISIPRSCRAR